MATLTLDLPMSKLTVADAYALPSVDFGFADLRARMSTFTAKFDAFIERERKRVLDERNTFRKNVADLIEEKDLKTRDIEIARQRSQQHQKQLSKESSETAEMHAAITTLSTHRATLAERKESLSTQLSVLHQRLITRRTALQKQQSYLASQARHNIPELEFWETHLCMRIEGAGVEDRLRFVWTHVCERDWEAPCWFELDTSAREYKVLRTRPELGKEEVDACVERLNEGRELGPFLKAMRECFVRAMK